MSENNDNLRTYRCICGKLLFKGLLLSSTIQIKCKKCGELISFQGLSDQPTREDKYALMTDKQGRVISASSNIRRLLGYELDEFLSHTLSSLTPKSSDKIFFDGFKRMWAIKNKQKYYFKSQTMHRRKNGSQIVGTMISKFITTPNGDYLFGIFRPGLSPTQSMNEPEFAGLIQYPYFGHINIDGVITYSAYAKENVVKKPLTKFLSEEKTSVEKELSVKLKKCKPFCLLAKRYSNSRSGNLITMDGFFTPSLDKHGKVTGFLTYFYDHASLT
jgi:PAS domain S-box-containing protein